MIKINMRKLKNGNLEITQDTLTDILSYIKGQDNEIKRLKESEEYHRKGFADLHKRINDAIETLDEWTIFETSDCTDRIINETLDILKRNDKMEKSEKEKKEELKSLIKEAEKDIQELADTGDEIDKKLAELFSADLELIKILNGVDSNEGNKNKTKGDKRTRRNNWNSKRC